MRKRFAAVAISALATAMLLWVGQSQAATIVTDDFESYADTPAMQANWGSTGLGTLDTTVGNPGKSGLHPGGTVNSWVGSSFSLAPTATHNVVLRADIFDDGTSANKRNTVGLRNGASPLFEMGHYNSTVNNYHTRLLNGWGGTGAWVAFDASLGSAERWNRYEATFSLTSAVITLDLGADGSVDFTTTYTGAAATNPFIDLRFGGPSNVTSGGGSINVDNIVLETVLVPEPTSLALVGLAGLFLRRRRAA